MTTLFLLLPRDFRPLPVLDQPESPAEHIRNALTLLIALKQQSPAMWMHVPELGRATRRAQAALTLVETHAPSRFAMIHVRGAVEALSDAPIDWELVPDIPAACLRLVQALFMLQSV